MPQLRIGGSFAPPLTDETLARYRAAIAAMSPSPVKDACVTMLRCCEKWWELPEPVGTERRAHPVGMGQIVSMMQEHKDALDEHIPWAHELDGIQSLFDGLEYEATVRNSHRIEAWQRAVVEAVRATYFKEPGVLAGLIKALKHVGVIMGLLTDKSRQEMEAMNEKVLECRAEITQVLSSKSHPTIPYPTPEPTPTRNMAFHLLWHVRELDLGREPLTTDLL